MAATALKKSFGERLRGLVKWPALSTRPVLTSIDMRDDSLLLNDVALKAEIVEQIRLDYGAGGTKPIPAMSIVVTEPGAAAEFGLPGAHDLEFKIETTAQIEQLRSTATKLHIPFVEVKL